YLARTGGQPPVSVTALDVASEHLRDVLDLAQIYMARPDDADRLARALRAMERRGGPEGIGNLAYLAMLPGLSRLVPSPVITLRGLLASPGALDALLAPLADKDTLIRTAVNQAFVLAGSAALPPLQGALERGDGRVRERVGEVLTLLGGGAADTALALLANPD